jgi:hypothetical protein
MRSICKIACLFFAICDLAIAQAPQTRQFVGTVSAFKADMAEIELKPDGAAPIVARITPASVIQKVAPGEKDLKNAQQISIADISIGDRVLVALEPETQDVRRIILMAASDISRRDEADRQAWTQRGISGVVASRSAQEIVLRTRTMQGQAEILVSVNDKTTFKRYATDSVRFADAKPSSIQEVRVGDQLRARGAKSEDSRKIAAEDIVFGTFQTRAGSITEIDPESKTITVKELGTNKTLLVKLTADSHLEKMPEFAGMMQMQKRGSFPPGGPPQGPPPAMASNFGARGGGPPELAQMLEALPAAKLDELKPGESIVVSSTQGSSADSLTAIMLVANADMLIQMASAQSSGRAGNRGGDQGINTMGGVSGLGGFELPGMIP